MAQGYFQNFTRNGKVTTTALRSLNASSLSLIRFHILGSHLWLSQALSDSHLPTLRSEQDEGCNQSASFLAPASATMAVGVVAAGCTMAVQPAAESGDSAPGAAAQSHINMLDRDDFEGPMQARAYMEDHPGVTIEMIPYAGEDAKLDSMIAAGTPPDLFVIGGENLIKYYVGGALLNLQPLIDADGSDLSIYFPQILEAPRKADGGLYGLGPDCGAELFYYNKTLFDQAGLSYPDDTWTWKEVTEAAEAMTQGAGAEKQYGILPYESPPSQYAVLWQNGVEIIDEAATTCHMDTPEAIEALDYMARLVHNEWAPAPQQLRGMGMDRGQLFAAGRVGMMSYGHWAIIYFDDKEKFEWEVTTLPKNKENATFLYQAIWSASSATKEPDLCWDFLKFSCSPEWSEKFVIEIGGLSSVKEVAERLAPSAGKHVPALAKVGRQCSTPRQRAPMSHVVNLNEVTDTAWNPAMDKLWSGEYTAEQAGVEITERANQILQQ